MDELWIIIIKYLSTASSLEEPAKGFFVLVNERKFMKKADEHQRGIFVVPIENDFTKDFCAAFEKIFKQHYNDYDDILFMKYFLSIIKKHVNTRFIFGHLYWCRRSTNNPNNCKFCCQVRRCWIFDKSETKFRFAYALYHYQQYDDHHENFFADTEYFTRDLNTIHKKCDYFEYVHDYNQLSNLFGIVSVRIFLNIGKNYFFLARMKKQYIYNYFIS